MNVTFAALNLSYPPDREAFQLLDLASRELHKAAKSADTPYLIAVQVPDPAEADGVAAHLVTNMQPAELRRALLSLLDRLGEEEAKGRV